MAAAQAPKVHIKQITISGQTIMQSEEIKNHELIQFDVANLEEHEFCELRICGIEYTGSDTKMKQLKSTKGGGVTPLGTIKIGS